MGKLGEDSEDNIQSSEEVDQKANVFAGTP